MKNSKDSFQTTLNDYLHFWQSTLRLKDWDIVIKGVKGYDISGRGRTSWNLSKRQAILQILHPDDHKPNEDFPYVPEKTVIHELLHLTFAPFDSHKEGTAKGDAVEWAIEAISDALLTLRNDS